MPDLSDPLDVMNSRTEDTRFRARKLRADAAMLIARAEELELLIAALEADVRDVQKWMPKGGTKAEPENPVKTGPGNGGNA